MKHRPIPTLPEVLKILTNSKLQLQHDFGVTRIGLFGSVLDGSAKSSSDIVIELDSEDTFTSFFTRPLAKPQTPIS